MICNEGDNIKYTGNIQRQKYSRFVGTKPECRKICGNTTELDTL